MVLYTVLALLVALIFDVHGMENIENSNELVPLESISLSYRGDNADLFFSVSPKEHGHGKIFKSMAYIIKNRRHTITFCLENMGEECNLRCVEQIVSQVSHRKQMYEVKGIHSPEEKIVKHLYGDTPNAAIAPYIVVKKSLMQK